MNAIEIKDILLITLPPLTVLLGWYLKGRHENTKIKGDIHKSKIEGVILTAEKIDEYVNALIAVKLEMLAVKEDLSDCLHDKKKCIELRLKVVEIIKIAEENADEAIKILKSL